MCRDREGKKKKKKNWGHTGLQLFIHNSGKENPSPNEEIMYQTDAHYAYLKLKIKKKIIYKEKSMKI